MNEEPPTFSQTSSKAPSKEILESVPAKLTSTPWDIFAVGSLVVHPSFGVGKIEAKQAKGEHWKLKVGFHGTTKPYQIIHSEFVEPIPDRQTAQQLLMKGIADKWAQKERESQQSTDGPDPSTFPIGSQVLHKKFGKGVIEYRRPVGKQWGLYIYFEKQGKGNLSVLSDYVIPMEEVEEDVLQGVKQEESVDWSAKTERVGLSQGLDEGTFPVGCYVYHARFGPGIVEGRSPLGDKWKLNIFFEKTTVGSQYVLSTFVKQIDDWDRSMRTAYSSDQWEPPEEFGASK